MWKLYQKNELNFALLWIGLYCGVMMPIRGSFGDESPWMFGALLAFSLALLAFLIRHQLLQAHGMTRWPKDQARLLYLLPLWILSTGNLWYGIRPVSSGAGQVFAVLSMALVGLVEEVIFRGFLFQAMRKQGSTRVAILVSSLTFGIGHIINLLTGQASLETFLQVLFAIAWGFLFTMVFYRGGSLLPCILAHSLIDVFSRFAVERPGLDLLYIAATILVALFYGLYLARGKEEAISPE